MSNVTNEPLGFARYRSSDTLPFPIRPRSTEICIDLPTPYPNQSNVNATFLQRMCKKFSPSVERVECCKTIFSHIFCTEATICGTNMIIPCLYPSLILILVLTIYFVYRVIISIVG